jgi:hypothetical protein
MDRNAANLLIKALITVLIAILFTIMALSQIKVAGLLSMVFFLFALMVLFFTKIDEKKFFLIFFFIYPLLPGLWGVTLPAGLPVLRAHRVAAIIMILYLMRNGLFFKYFGNFIKAKMFNYPILFIVLAMLATSLFSSAVVSSLFVTTSFVIEYFILAVVVYNVFQRREDIDSLTNILCYATITMCLFGLYERFTEVNIFHFFGTYMDEDSIRHMMRDGSIRIVGPFPHSISFGVYLAMMLPLMLYKFKDSYPKFFLSIGLVMLIIMSTQSRGAQIGAGIAIMSHFIFIEKKKLILLGFSSIPIIILYSEKIYDYLQQLNPLTTTDTALIASTMDRSIQFNFYIEFVKDRIMFGHGQEPAPFFMRDFHDGSTGVYARTIDNFYLGYSFQYGIVGLAAWIFLMLMIIVKPIMIYGRQIFNEKLVICLLCAFIIFDVTNIIVFLMHYQFILWIFIGILTRLLVIKLDESKNIVTPPLSSN